MEQYYLCQSCYYVIKTEYSEENWKAYHQTMDSCPECHKDMCGCNGCGEDAKKIYSVMDMKEIIEDEIEREINFGKNFLIDCSFYIEGDCVNCPLEEEGLCLEFPFLNFVRSIVTPDERLTSENLLRIRQQ